jgi:hypothetical protein
MRISHPQPGKDRDGRPSEAVSSHSGSFRTFWLRRKKRPSLLGCSRPTHLILTLSVGCRLCCSLFFRMRNRGNRGFYAARGSIRRCRWLIGPAVRLAQNEMLSFMIAICRSMTRPIPAGNFRPQARRRASSTSVRSFARVSRLYDLIANRVADESCRRRQIELSHDRRAMRLHCFETYSEKISNLFVCIAFSNKLHYAPLAVRKS